MLWGSRTCGTLVGEDPPRLVGDLEVGELEVGELCGWVGDGPDTPPLFPYFGECTNLPSALRADGLAGEFSPEPCTLSSLDCAFSRRRDCHFTNTRSAFSRCINSDGERAPAR